MKKFLLSTVLSSVGLLFPGPLFAQFIGNVSPQTVTNTLASAMACSGSEQDFITGGTYNGVLFSNLGQTVHLATISINSGTPTHLTLQINGIDSSGAIIPISDHAEAGGGVLHTAVIGIGYYPKIQVAVTCSPATATYTLNYAGVSSSPNPTSGAYLSASANKVLYFSAAAGTSASDSFQTPFDNSSGLITFSYAGGAGPTGSTLSVTCDGLDGNPQGASGNWNLGTSTTPQQFHIPAGPCFSTVLVYTAGGSSSNTFSLEYDFSVPGLPLTLDPCKAGGLLQSIPINVNAAGTTQLLAPVTGASIYVCGGHLDIASSATTAATAKFEYGTGSSCGTGTTALTGTMGTGQASSSIGAQPVSLSTFGTNLEAPAGNALCIVTAGTTVSVQGYINLVQQ
jgi:hypothetical protein